MIGQNVDYRQNLNVCFNLQTICVHPNYFSNFLTIFRIAISDKNNRFSLAVIHFEIPSKIQKFNRGNNSFYR